MAILPSTPKACRRCTRSASNFDSYSMYLRQQKAGQTRSLLSKPVWKQGSNRQLLLAAAANSNCCLLPSCHHAATA
jgi:hypothetical protein